jgi:serine/threonine-protein kinase
VDATVADPVIGRLIDGRYTAQEKLAVGGMATVYIAHDNRLDRMVALKVMHPNLMHEQDSVARFNREAKAVAQLVDTPRVVSVFDFGSARTPAGVLNYLVMELVRGRSLRQYLGSHGRLPTDEALEIIEAVAEALAAAHARGIIHRDIKPENILLGDDGQVKVADFGLARPITQPTAALTQGVVMGTVGYLAPEQVTHGNADYRSDVYAAGVVLFEMLTGQLPHTGATPMSVAYQSVHGDVPTPSTIVPGIPPALDDLVLRATSRRPEQRPADGAALLDSVRRVLPYVVGEPGPDGTATTVYPGGYTGAQAPSAGYAPTRVERRSGGPDLDSYLDAPGAYEDRSGYGRTSEYNRGDYDDYDDAAGGPAYGRRGHRAGAGGFRRPPNWMIGVGAAAVVLLLIIIGLSSMLGGGNGGVLVPAVIGETKTDATHDITAAGLKVKFGTPVNDTTQPVDHVVSETPADSSRVGAGSTITLVVSLGPAQIAVPDLKGKSLTDAQTALQNAGLIYGGNGQSEPSNAVPKDAVVETVPPAGTKVTTGTQIQLRLSSGPQVSQVPSDIIGETYQQAQAELTTDGLTVQVDPSSTSTDPTATVMASSPSPGDSVQPGDTITLTLSSGNGSGQMVTVPNITKGMSQDKANSMLQDAGLQAKFVGGSILWWTNKVKGISPAAGARVPQGSTVTVYVQGD